MLRKLYNNNTSLIKRSLNQCNNHRHVRSMYLFTDQTNDFMVRNRNMVMNINHNSKYEYAKKSIFNWKTLLSVVGGTLLAKELLLDEAEACGIVAFVGKEPATQYLLEGLLILQNRGYDSAGISTINKETNELRTTKYASQGSTSDSIDLVMQKAPGNHGADSIGIAHTRWATHGGKTDVNAHPHYDHDERLALVHNGTIENADTIRDDLIKKGITFRSQTDTEVIVQLIGYHVKEGIPLLEATKLALSQLEGTWGICLIDRQKPDQIIAARNGSPLVVGVDKDRMFVASEVTAFSRHCSDFVALKDGEIAVISNDRQAGGIGQLDLARLEKAPKLDIELSPAPYPHWTLKEIMEQPQAVARALNYGARFGKDGRIRLGGLDQNQQVLLPIKHLVIAACGTSHFAGMYGERLFRSLRAFDTIQSIDAAEFNSESVPPHGGGLLVISQSGETKDTHRALEVAHGEGVPRFSVVNAVGSLIARTTRCGVYLNAGRENAVASTKAFTTQVTAMALIANWFAEHRTNQIQSLQTRQEIMDGLHRLPTYIGMTLRCHQHVREIAEKIKDQEHVFVLGKGLSYPIAMEGALKIKEISYIHAEGYSGGALKHGPFALLDDKTPVIMLILNDQHAELMRIAAAQVRARGAHTIIITDNPQMVQGVADDVIDIPSNGPLTALLGVVPLQLLAYELSLLRGNDPDKPRHLAKAVTVD